MKYNAFRQRYHARGSGLVWNASIRRRKGTGGPVTPEITFDELVASLISAGETVAFYDPNDLTSIYTARTGGANAVADGPVGLMLDKAQMGGLTAAEFIAAQPELVTNGDGSSVLGWNVTANATVSIVAGNIRVESTSDINASKNASQAISVTPGKPYLFGYSLVDESETSAQIRVGNSVDGQELFATSSVGSGTYLITPLVSTIYVTLRASSEAQVGEGVLFDNVSVVELPGYHATAPSDAARPILRDVSSTYALDFDNVDDAFAWTTPAIADGTWVALTRNGSYAASSAYSAGTYTMPVYQPFDLCAILWTSADLTTVQEAIVLAEGSARGAAADFGAVTNFANGFRARTDLRDFPVIDTGSGTNFQEAWRSCAGLISFPLIDTSSGTSFFAAWYNCNSLTSFPALDTSSGTNFSYAWFQCASLTSFPSLDVSNGTNFSVAWYQCTSLASFPALDVSSGTNFSETWFGCTSLTTFPANMFDSVTATNFIGAFTGTNLTQTSIDNILTSINTAGTSGGIFNQSGGSAPSATGEAAIDALRGRGWTVTVTGGY
jgi:hypothetical protein